MKLTRLSVQSFLGVRSAELSFETPITLFAGRNGAAKSSLSEAVRMALTGESVRVEHKKDYRALLTDEATAGFAEVEFVGGKASITLPSGAQEFGAGEMRMSLPAAATLLGAIGYVLDAPRFSSLDGNARRAFLFQLMNLSAGGEAVRQRLLDRGCDAERVEAVMPLLRAGFDAACTEAKAKARDAKAAWRTVTGETYGEKKALTWRCAKPAFDAAALDRARADLAKIEEEIETGTAKLGELQGRAVQAQEQQGKMAGLRQTASLYARIADKLNRDEFELGVWTRKVAETREKAGTPAPTRPAVVDATLRGLATVAAEFLTLTHESEGLAGYRDDGTVAPWAEFESLLNRADQHLTAYQREHGALAEKPADPEAQAKLPEYEKALELYQRSVDNGKRDLAESNRAAEALAELDKAGLIEVPDEGEINVLKARMEALKGSRRTQQATIAELQGHKQLAEQADRKTEQAAQHHADVQAWDAIAGALAPDGIPGEMLAEALNPINGRLAESAQIAEWPAVRIAPDMAITYGARPIGLCSESERWRADAMIAEAISYLSGAKLLVLDRVDVLDLKGREDLLYWLSERAADGDLDSALLFATLKALPAQLPAGIQGVWIEGGVVGQQMRAAA